MALMDTSEPAATDSIYNALKNFEIDKKIGKGQFSEVYRARCTVDNTIVALKKVQVGILDDLSLKVVVLDIHGPLL